MIRIMLGLRYKKDKEGRKAVLEITGRGMIRIARGCLVAVQDIFLFLFAGVGIVLLSFRFNQGRFRFFTVLALIFGFYAYYSTIGKLMLRLSQPIVLFVRKIFLLVFSAFFRPIRVFVEIFGRISKKIYTKFKKGIAKRRKIVYNIYSLKCMKKKVAEGFLKDELL
ncbi:MAG: spore cortex biosynthesis protein YabQ [Clostridia bacterium]|nr:spore cortex biosynthesis protein YabQ [Clostridia bacterium]